MQYTLPKNIFDELVKNVGKDNAEKFANAIEKFLEIIQQKESLKAELYNELRNELATKEFVRAEINEVKAEINEVKTEINEVKTEINEVRAEIKNNNLLLKVLIGISLFALTVFNPNFVSLIEKIIK